MRTKKILILITCLCVLTSLFTACGQKKNTDTSLVGSWSGQIDMTEYIKGEINEALGDYAQYATFENVCIDIDLEFTENEITASFKEESFDNLATTLTEAYTPIAEKMLEDTATESGISLTDIFAELGTDKETFIQQTINAPIEQVVTDTKSSMQSESAKLSGEYYLENAKICDYKGNAYSYTLTNNVLNITFTSDNGEYSLILEK